MLQVIVDDVDEVILNILDVDIKFVVIWVDDELEVDEIIDIELLDAQLKVVDDVDIVMKLFDNYDDEVHDEL